MKFPKYLLIIGIIFVIVLIYVFVRDDSAEIIPLKENTCTYFFYGDGCPHCANVEPFLDDLEAKNPNVQIERFETWHDEVNNQIMKDYFDAYNVPSNQRGVPILFIADKFYVGDTPILDNLVNEIVVNEGAECPALE